MRLLRLKDLAVIAILLSSFSAAGATFTPPNPTAFDVCSSGCQYCASFASLWGLMYQDIMQQAAHPVCVKGGPPCPPSPPVVLSFQLPTSCGNLQNFQSACTNTCGGECSGAVGNLWSALSALAGKYTSIAGNKRVNSTTAAIATSNATCLSTLGTNPTPSTSSLRATPRKKPTTTQMSKQGNIPHSNVK